MTEVPTNVGLSKRVINAIERAVVTDAMVLWALSGFCFGIVILGIFVLLSTDKFSDYLAYSLPCLAAVTFGGNFLKEEFDRWMFVVSIILLIGGFNAYLYSYGDSWIIYLVEFVMVIGYFAGTLYHLRKHNADSREAHGKKAEKVFFNSVISLSILICLAGLYSVGHYYWAQHRLHVLQDKIMKINTSRSMSGQKQKVG